ncbi:MAG: hypothetical protein LLF96_02530, partial [Eubacteriales bacterium]|nr:hypothetical protein [Eubacteriales bacterium]
MKNKELLYSFLKCSGATLGTWCTVMQLLPLMHKQVPSFMQNLVHLIAVILFVTLVYFSFIVSRVILKTHKIHNSEREIRLCIGNLL